MQNSQSKIIVFILILLIVFVGVYFFFSRVPDSKIVTANFSHDGNLTKDNPGYIPGVWYLVYEETGAPGLYVQLKFDTISEPNLQVGDRVHVEGTLKDSIVSVKSISIASSTLPDSLKVSLYFYNPNRDQGPGGPQCSKNGLVAVTRYIPRTTTPLKDTINLLLRGEITAEEEKSGITTEFPLSNVSLVSADIKNGVATLKFNDPNNRTGGGSCRVSILWAEIEATAKQFPNIESVNFEPKTLFQP